MAFRRYLNQAEQRKLTVHLNSLAGTYAQRDRAWINLLRCTGMRIGEFSQLNVSDARLALENGWIFVPKERRKGKPEDRVDLYVRVTRPVHADLETLLELQLKTGGSGADEEALVYSRKHRRMSVRGYQERMACRAGAVGINASPHWLRHTRGKNIMKHSKSEDPRGLVQAALGHKSISSTGIYTQLDKDEVARALDSIDGPARARKKDVRKIYEARVGA